MTDTKMGADQPRIPRIIPATGHTLRSPERLPRRVKIINRAGKKTYDLVFEGGGAKGIAFAGTLQALEKAEHKVGRLLGTSAGAITATLLCLGFSESELVEVLAEKTPDGKAVLSTFTDSPTSFKESTYNDSRVKEAVDDMFLPGFVKGFVVKALIGIFTSTPLLRSLFSLIERGGFYKGDAFYYWFVSQINKKYPGMGETLTFEKLYNLNGKDLTVCASDVTSQMLMALNHRTAPDLPIAKAVRMSMSIPFYWQEIIWDEKWGKYNNMDVNGDVIVDGGVLSNIPLELFLSDEESITELMGPKTTDIVMGCSLDDTVAPKEYDVISKEGKFDEIKTLQRVGRLINTMMKANDKVYLREYAEFVARCPTKGLGVFEFDADENKRNLFIHAAYAATMNTIKQIDSSALNRVSEADVNQHAELLDPKVHGKIATGTGSKAGSAAATTEVAKELLQVSDEQQKQLATV